MAKIIFSDNGKEINVKDKEPIKNACEKIGISFSENLVFLRSSMH